MGKLLTVTYPNPQAAADRLVPLGWCSQCVAEAKMAELAGAEPVPVRAAVTAIPSMQQVPVPGQGVRDGCRAAARVLGAHHGAAGV